MKDKANGVVDIAADRSTENARAGRQSCRACDELRIQWALALRMQLLVRGMSIRAAAGKMGIDEKILREKLHGLRPIWLEEVAALGPDVEAEILEARARFIRERIARGLTPEQHALRCASRAGALAEATAEAMADGFMSTEEKHSVLHAAQELRSELNALETDVERQ